MSREDKTELLPSRFVTLNGRPPVAALYGSLEYR
jgi:hypothetical protein